MVIDFPDVPTKGIGAVVFPTTVVLDGATDGVNGTGIVSGDGTNICPYTVVALFADETAENIIIIL